MPGRSFRGLLWTLALLGASLDLGGKYLVFRWLYNDGHGGKYDLVPGWFQFLTEYSGERAEPGLLAPLQTWSGETLPKVNHGALFGVGGRYKYLANGMFAAVSLMAALAIAGWSLRPGACADWSLCTALGLILAGTLGNLYDRIVFTGVRDFMYFYYIDWPVFNFADCCLVCGAGLLLSQAFWAPHAETQGQDAAPLRTTPELAEAK